MSRFARSAVRTKPARPEDNLQRLVVDYLRFVLPFDGFRVAHIPNGGFRSKIEASVLKGLGVLPGMPDIIIVGQGGVCRFMELKSLAGRLSPGQQAMRDWMITNEVPYAEVRSLADAKAALASWGVLTREAA